MKKERIQLAPVIRVINSLEQPGETQCNLEQCICILDTAKQLLLYHRETMQSGNSFIQNLRSLVEQV